MFENAGEIVVLVLAVIVTWVVARASGAGGGPGDRTMLSALRDARHELPSMRTVHNSPGVGVSVLPAGDPPEYDLIRVIERPDVARTA